MHRTVLLASLIDILSGYQELEYVQVMFFSRVQISHKRCDAHLITMLVQVDKLHNLQGNLWVQQGIVDSSLSLIIGLVDGEAIIRED